MKTICTALFILTIMSCSVSRNVKATVRTEEELVRFYTAHNVDLFWIPRDRPALEELYKADRLSMPQNIVFNSDGYEILHFNDKLCVNHTLEFLKTYNAGMEIKVSKYHISEYVKHLKSLPGQVNIESTIVPGEINVFVNTGLIGEQAHANDEAFAIYQSFKDKFNVHVVNIDFRKDTSDSQTDY